MEQREVNKVVATISSETGKKFRQVRKDDKVEDVYSKPVELASCRYAVVENAKEFSHVPWCSVLEHSKGKFVSGVVGGAAYPEILVKNGRGRFLRKQ
ncbi:DUF3363 domain-containing protein [Paremcibacter congregatus]|uniref:Uncharacterized protein n=1 Tax=Paremcibacter congregatus TaxID=2043170 RepID=A0A2G4YNM9_9PROT|nr:DUF3363 domain-containing protein [Paremcibacter congregatus]PHZ83895.1 hypothetical protein CRD36_16230 [Paremcibacter congregatus]QDE27599.1 DUF3363 domain-containing protein [Paremcibacter congregatus]